MSEITDLLGIPYDLKKPYTLYPSIGTLYEDTCFCYFVCLVIKN